MRPFILGAATAPNNENIHTAKSIHLRNAADNVFSSTLTLNKGRAKDYFNIWRTSRKNIDNIAQSRTGGRCNYANPKR